MKKFAVACAATIAALGAASPAFSAHKTTCEKAYGVRAVVVKKLGSRAPGRNICRFGVVKHGNERPATRAEKRVYLRQLRELIAPTGHALLGRVAIAPSRSPAGTLTPSVRGIGPGGSANPNVNPACESGGNPQAVSPAGYWGKYQFDRQTWTRFGGSAASYGSAGEAEQDAVAARVTYDAWPNC